LAVGLAVRYSQKIPYVILSSVFLISIGLRYSVDDYSFQAQILCYGCAVLQAIAAWTIFPVLRSGGRYILFGTVVVFAAQLFLVPLITVHVMNETLTANSFGDSFFLAVLNFSVALTSVCLATCLFIDLGMDIIRRYRDESRTDMLTGLYNRRAFEDLVEQACYVGPKQGGPAALILCDIDHFKAVNDTYGHASGDRVIKGLAGVLSARCQGADYIGRLGGEEFGVFMPGATLEMAQLAAERLRMDFENYRCPHLTEDTVFTASFGVAVFQESDPYETVFARADAGLYVAKNAGRNCVRLSPDVTGLRQIQSPVCKVV